MSSGNRTKHVTDRSVPVMEAYREKELLRSSESVSVNEVDGVHASSTPASASAATYICALSTSKGHVRNVPLFNIGRNRMFTSKKRVEREDMKSARFYIKKTKQLRMSLLMSSLDISTNLFLVSYIFFL